MSKPPSLAGLALLSCLAGCSAILGINEPLDPPMDADIDAQDDGGAEVGFDAATDVRDAGTAALDATEAGAPDAADGDMGAPDARDAQANVDASDATDGRADAPDAVEGSTDGPDASERIVLVLSVQSGSSTDFGQVLLDQTKDEVFVLANTGRKTSTAVTISLPASDPFAILPPVAGDCVSGTTTLSAGATCNVRVRFVPKTRGDASTTLTALASVGETAALSLHGKGIVRAILSIDAAPGSSASFGIVVAGQTKIEDYLVSNTGDQPSLALSLRLDSQTGNFTLVAQDGDCQTGITTLAPGIACHVHVAFLAPFFPTSDSATLIGSDSATQAALPLSATAVLQ